MIFHVSDKPCIERFDPRLPESGGPPVVWGIDAEHLRNYLLPRDCPRVTFYANKKSSSADVDRFLGLSDSVVAVENIWLERIRSTQLFCYCLPPTSFKCIDEYAGYFTSEETIIPTAVETFDDVFAELVKRRVEIRLLPNLWHLHDAVAASTLQFSMIRMRKALRRSQCL